MVWGLFSKITGYLRRILLNSDVPVWLTIVFAVLGAFAAYYIAPVINETFELQRARREFVVNGLNSVATETTSIVEVANKLASSDRRDEWNEARDELLSALRRAQFESVKLVLVSKDGSNIVIKYQEALQEMQNSAEILQFQPGEDYAAIRLLSRNVAEEAVRVNIFLLEIVGLR